MINHAALEPILDPPPLIQRVGRLLRRNDGASAAEFAMILPLLLLFLFGIVQYGIMFFAYNNMSNAAREGARAMAVGEVDAAGAQTLAGSYLVGWTQDDAIIAADTITQAEIDFARVRISVPGAKAGVVDYGPSPATISATVLMRIE